MAQISTAQIQELRAKTGVSIMDCKRALEEARGDLAQAETILRKKGASVAEKKSARETQNGIVTSYIHSNNRVGVLLDLRCETDFVARNEEFKNLAHELCMHIAAMNPRYIAAEDIPQDVADAERGIYTAQFADSTKPRDVLAKILEGKMKKFAAEQCLLLQPFVKDDSLTIGELITNAIAKLGENIKIAAFCRYEI